VSVLIHLNEKSPDDLNQKSINLIDKIKYTTINYGRYFITRPKFLNHSDHFCCILICNVLLYGTHQTIFIKCDFIQRIEKNILRVKKIVKLGPTGLKEI